MTTTVPEKKHAHTPGPWRVMADCAADARVQCADGRFFLIGDTLYHPENAANARLIAAAPELLDALQAVLAIMCDKPLCGHFTTEEIREAVMGAIAKAEGR